MGLQIEYSLVERTVERELTPMAKALGLTITAWSPLAGGVLSGKYQAGTQATDARFSSDMMKAVQATGDRVEKIVPAVKQVPNQLGRSPAQGGMAWLLHRDQPIIPIIGTRKLAQTARQPGGALEVKLNSDQVTLLDQASAIQLGFPLDFYASEMVRGFAYGGTRDKIIV